MKAILVSAVVVATACTRNDLEVRLKRLEVQQRGLVQQLDGLQARLLVDRERVNFWIETRERRERTTALACEGEGIAEPGAVGQLVPSAAAQHALPSTSTARLAVLQKPGAATPSAP